MMHVSILIATYRRPEILRQSLVKYCELDTRGLGWELIVVDNADDERTRAIAEQFQTRIPIQYMIEKKLGKARALNAGIPHLKGSLCLFADDDVHPNASWVREMWEGAKRWPAHLVFGGKIYPKFPVEPNPWDMNTMTMKTAYGLADWGDTEAEYPTIRVWGGNMAVRVSVFQKGLRFNDEIWSGENPIAGEESELVTRISRQGHRPVYLPRSIVHHQIRPEQLTVAWLRRRAFIRGRTFAFVSGLPNPTAYHFGIPSSIIRGTLEHIFRYIKRFLFVTRHDRVQQSLLLLNYIGRVYQYWLGVPKERLVDYK